MKLISNLSAAIIPHSLWSSRKWYSSAPWYYHQPGDGFFLPEGISFYNSIDPGLRGICRLLHSLGLRTSPSCEGHFHTPALFFELWETLLNDAHKIQKDGIIVTDSTTGNAMRFQNSDYTLPWPSFDAFLDQCMWHQRTGYLQIWIPQERHQLRNKIEAALQSTEICGIEYGTSKTPSGSTFIEVRVETLNALDQRKAWKYIEWAINMVVFTDGQTQSC